MDNPREHAHPSTKEYTKARPWRESPKLSSIPENKGGEVLIENRSRNPIIITIVSLMTNQSFLNEVVQLVKSMHHYFRFFGKELAISQF